MNLSTTKHRRSMREQRWLVLATAVLLVLVLLPWLVPFGPLQGDAGGTMAAVLVMGVPAVLLAGAARRGDLDIRLRQALALLVGSIGLAVLGNLVRLLTSLGVPTPQVPGISVVSNVIIWALGIAALLRIPLVRLGRGAAWQFGTDTAIAVGGLALAIFAVWTLPGFAHAPRAARLQLLAFNAMAAANLVALNLILVRGPRRALRRAVWCLAATIIIETTYLVAMQYALGRQSADFRVPNSLFFVDYLAFLFAGVFFLRDPQPNSDIPLLPEQVRAFNPLPMAAIVGVSALLVLSTRHPSDPALFPLAVGLGAMALLLLARVVGATTVILRFAREEAATLQRQQTERLQLMRRLAGGIAHVINNLMGVVLMNSELVVDVAGSNEELRTSGQEIGESARLASGLASRLLLASGHRPFDAEHSSLREAVRAQRELVGQAAGSREMAWEVDEMGGQAIVAPSSAAAVLRELVSNAIEASPEGGRITIRVHDDTRAATHDGMTLAPPPGRYSVLEVEDAGCGIAPDSLARACEPFFTTHDLSEGRGLGLSVVYGVMASSGGGLQIESNTSTGTRVSAYFPVSLPDVR
ncbi:MAG: ATP-binding protein [Gemmatimonadota bacterium]